MRPGVRLGHRSIRRPGCSRSTLDPQVTLTGTVQVGSGTAAKTVAATVVATRPSRIIGRPDVVYQAAVNPIDGSYTLVVSRSLVGEQYALRVSTTDSSLVPPQDAERASPTSTRRSTSPSTAPLTLPELHGTIARFAAAAGGRACRCRRRRCRRRRLAARWSVDDDDDRCQRRLLDSAGGRARRTRCMLTATPTDAGDATTLPSLTRIDRHDQARADERADGEPDDAAAAGDGRGHYNVDRHRQRRAPRCR